MPKLRPSERCPRFTAPRDFRLSQSLQHASPLSPHPTIRTTQHSTANTSVVKTVFVTRPRHEPWHYRRLHENPFFLYRSSRWTWLSVFVFSSVREDRREMVNLFGFKVHCYITIFDCKDCIRIYVNLTLGRNEEINSTRGCWPCRQAADMGTIRCELTK